MLCDSTPLKNDETDTVRKNNWSEIYTILVAGLGIDSQLCNRIVFVERRLFSKLFNRLVIFMYSARFASENFPMKERNKMFFFTS